MLPLTELVKSYLDRRTVDKFIGDAIMVVFNAHPQKDHIERAVVRIRTRRLCEKFYLKMRRRSIGVTGLGYARPTTVGNFGSQSRMDFTPWRHGKYCCQNRRCQ